MPIPIKKGKKLPLIQAIQRLKVALADARDAARDAYRPGLGSVYWDDLVKVCQDEEMIVQDKEEE